MQLIAVNAVLVIVWSIASWRDAYRPLAAPVHPGWYLATVPIGFATFAMAIGWSWGLRRWLNLPDDAPMPAAEEEYSWAMQLVLTAVSPAIVEELAFRGIMFPGLARTLKGWETVVVTGLMFMVLHVQVPMFPPLLVGGLLLGYMRLKTGSWLPGVFVHFTHNFLCLIAGKA